MDSDLMLVMGAMALVLSVPSILAAWTEGHVPRIGAILVMAGGTLVVLALKQNARPYTFAELPGVFFGVIDRFLP